MKSLHGGKTVLHLWEKSTTSSGYGKREMKRTLWNVEYTRAGLLEAENQDTKGKNRGGREGGGKDWHWTVMSRERSTLMTLSCQKAPPPEIPLLAHLLSGIDEQKLMSLPGDQGRPRMEHGIWRIGCQVTRLLQADRLSDATTDQILRVVAGK